MIACHRQGVDNDAAIDADHGQHDAEEQTEPEARQQESEQIVPHVAVGQVHRLALRRGPRGSAFLQCGTDLGDDLRAIGEAGDDLQPRILRAMAE